MGTKKKTGLLLCVVAVTVQLSVASRPAVHLPERRVQGSKSSKTSKGSKAVHPLWPEYLSSQVSLYTRRPTNTTEAAELQWVKSDDPCVPTLGEPWIYKGERGVNSSATLYFTPASGNIPGSLSGIEVDYYGYLEENLVGTYFSEKRMSKDGAYHSLAVALRNTAKEDPCAEDVKRDPHDKYVVIAPGLADEVVPTTTSSRALKKKWQEGSCIRGMGYHWSQDTVGGKDLTFQANNTVPIVPMYDDEGDIAAIFFLATAAKQNWADSCSIDAPTPECIGALNFWDPGPGLTQENKPRFYVCSNFCGNCQFTGSGSDPGMYTTMHWFFKDPFGPTMQCAGSDTNPYCSSGEYPSLSLFV